MANLVDGYYRPKIRNSPEYIEAKIKMLQEQFLIELTELDKTWLRSCKNEFETDRVARQIIMEHWGVE